MSKCSVLYTWNDDIISYLKENNIKVTVVGDGCSCSQKKKQKDSICFKIKGEKDEKGQYTETYPEAFFRHIRNAFAHYSIKRQQDYYLIVDVNGSGQKTMTAWIKSSLILPWMA